MNKNLFLPALLVAAMCLTGCASSPPAEAPTPAADGRAESKPRWSMASEKEVAAALDLEVQKAAKSYVQLKKDGVLMFCKRYRQIGSNLPTIQCITEAQLRTQVENMTKYRDDMRNRGGKCGYKGGCDSGS
jgi:type IV pilus biogenesis protein CpaD/CtpE